MSSDDDSMNETAQAIDLVDPVWLWRKEQFLRLEAFNEVEAEMLADSRTELSWGRRLAAGSAPVDVIRRVLL